MSPRRVILCLALGILLGVLSFILAFYFYQEYYDKNRQLDRFKPTNFNAWPDRLGAIPDFNGSLPFAQYSGYLESLDSNRLFYWFVESESPNPVKDPLVLWLNGGPGCSSLFGLFSELGPIRMHIDGTMAVHPYAWNKKANILFLESPAGTGFSYRPYTSKYKTNDEDTAKVNFAALKSFFAKFPQYVNNSFYITGESYAGRYIPQLGAEVINRKFPVNFKGVAIGNGYLDPLLDKTTSLNFVMHHNLTGFTRTINLIDPKANNTIYKYNIRKECIATYPSQIGYVDDDSAFKRTKSPDQLPPCGNEIPLTEYLNREDVQDAFHVHRNSGVGNWTICSLLKSGYMEYDEKDDWGRSNMIDEIRYLVNAGIKVIIYNGDMDIVCNFMAAQQFVENLGFRNIAFEEPWTHNNVTIGLFNHYEKNLSFLRVFDAGHMVPIDKPEEALLMFNEILLEIK